MEIRIVKRSDYKNLANLFQGFFIRHNIFSLSEKEIIKYLKKESKKSKLVVCAEENCILAALFIVKIGQDIEGKHTLWKFRHFAYCNEKAAVLLLKNTEEKVKKLSETSKIELTLAENEKGVKFFQKNGYRVEGKLKNHYRWNETCIVISKSFSGK
jgi:hypothetical protein